MGYHHSEVDAKVDSLSSFVLMSDRGSMDVTLKVSLYRHLLYSFYLSGVYIFIFSFFFSLMG